MGEYIIPTWEEVRGKLTNYPREIEHVIADIHSDFRIDIFDLTEEEWIGAVAACERMLGNLERESKVVREGSTVQLRFRRQYDNVLWRFEDFHVTCVPSHAAAPEPGTTQAVPLPLQRWIEVTCRRSITRVLDFTRVGSDYHGKTFVWTVDFSKRTVVGEELSPRHGESLYRAIWLESTSEWLEELAKEGGYTHHLADIVGQPELSQVLPIPQQRKGR